MTYKRYIIKKYILHTIKGYYTKWSAIKILFAGKKHEFKYPCWWDKEICRAYREIHGDIAMYYFNKWYNNATESERGKGCQCQFYKKHKNKCLDFTDNFIGLPTLRMDIPKVI